MSEIRAYLEAKAQDPREWLRRDPRTTDPGILELVREFRAGGGFYDDDAERYVAERIGDMPEHYSHSEHKRHPLTDQLGHEIYIANNVLRDERAREVAQAALADGYFEADGSGFVAGRRYLVRFGTVYGGRSEPDYGPEMELRTVADGRGGVALLPKGARTNGYRPTAPMLAKAVNA